MDSFCTGLVDRAGVFRCLREKCCNICSNLRFLGCLYFVVSKDGVLLGCGVRLVWRAKVVSLVCPEPLQEGFYGSNRVLWECSCIEE